ncbi:MAG TPA: transposase [Flavobacterium sp.]
MERKVKYNYEFKLRCVEEVLKKHQSVTTTANKNGLATTNLKEWISYYIQFGNEGLLPRQENASYSVDFKLKVLQTIQKNSLSLGKACLIFDIRAKSTILGWQRKYTKEGLAGLELKLKGRPTPMNSKRAKKTPDKPLTREEELLRENEYLRCEIALLKKFNALIQAKKLQQQKRLKP